VKPQLSGNDVAVRVTVGFDGSSCEVGSINHWPVGGVDDPGEQIRVAGVGVVVKGAADDGSVGEGGPMVVVEQDEAGRTGVLELLPLA
jgi:hypothetical protein